MRETEKCRKGWKGGERFSYFPCFVKAHPSANFALILSTKGVRISHQVCVLFELFVLGTLRIRSVPFRISAVCWSVRFFCAFRCVCCFLRFSSYKRFWIPSSPSTRSDARCPQRFYERGKNKETRKRELWLRWDAKSGEIEESAEITETAEIAENAENVETIENVEKAEKRRKAGKCGKTRKRLKMQTVSFTFRALWKQIFERTLHSLGGLRCLAYCIRFCVSFRTACTSHTSHTVRFFHNFSCYHVVVYVAFFSQRFPFYTMLWIPSPPITRMLANSRGARCSGRVEKRRRNRENRKREPWVSSKPGKRAKTRD